MPSGVKDIQLLELKDTISQLNKTISTQNELLSSLQRLLEECHGPLDHLLFQALFQAGV